MEENNEENLILKAYRNKEKEGTIDIDIKGHTYGFELYRISLMLINQLLRLDKDFEFTEKNIQNFFNDMGADYNNFYLK